MAKMNCWEYEKCGREPGGDKEHEMGVCPAASAEEADGFCEGKNGGRACAYIDNTYCKGQKQGNRQEKLSLCFSCIFYKILQGEEGANFSIANYREHTKK